MRFFGKEKKKDFYKEVEKLASPPMLLLKSKESVYLLQELEVYLKRIIEFSDFDTKQEFLNEFILIKDAVSNEIANDSNWPKKYEVCLKIQIFFKHGMCSKWEYAPSDLSINIDSFVEATNGYLKLCYKELGNQTYNIDTSELFNLGEEVYLVQKELLNLSNFGAKEYVDSVTRHIYTIKKILDNDISNMPQYIIESGGFSRLARHNALRKAKS